MTKPAGVQIKRWFVTLVILLSIVNLISVVSLFIVYNRIDEIKSAYQPIVKSSSVINARIMSAETDLYKYLAEYQNNLSSVYNKTNALIIELNRIKNIINEYNLQDSMDMNLLEGIIVSTETFVEAIKRLESMKKQEKKNWELIDDLNNEAMEMGAETLRKAAIVSSKANLLINKHNIKVRKIALTVVSILFVFLIVSVIIMVQLLHWWRTFEDLILEL